MIKILWDWNGTLLDDLETSLSCIQQLQKENGIPPFKGLEDYRQVFCFPLQEYYEKSGFDFKKILWKNTGERFMALYLDRFARNHLNSHACEALEFAAKHGMANYILSASRWDLLREQIGHFPLLRPYLCGVYGIDNIFATSKEQAAHDFMATCLPWDEVYLIGDTLHDLEVARAIGCSFVACDTGHQAAWRFREQGIEPCSTLMEAVKDIYGRSCHHGQ